MIEGCLSHCQQRGKKKNPFLTQDHNACGLFSIYVHSSSFIEIIPGMARDEALCPKTKKGKQATGIHR